MSQVNQLETQRAENAKAIELRDEAIKLSTNREFKKLILDGFCRDDCARYAQLSADPALNAEQRADSLALAQSAGHLRRYLSMLIAQGNRAENQNLEIEAELDAVRLEEAVEHDELAHAHQLDQDEED